MNKDRMPEINVEELIKQVEAEVKRRSSFAAREESRRNQHHGSAEGGRFAPSPLELEPFAETEPFDANRKSHHINDFFRYRDAKFIEHAYNVILCRQPDGDGFQYYLTALRHGKMNKTEVLGRLRYSSEGKAKGIKIKGLLLPFMVQSSYQIPVLGYFVRWAAAILQAPTIFRNYQKLDAYVQNHFLDMEDYLEQLRDKVQTKVNEIIENQCAIRDAVDSKAARSELETLASKKVDAVRLEELGIGVDALSQKADKSALEELRKAKADKTELDLFAHKNAVTSLGVEFQTMAEEFRTLKSSWGELESAVCQKAEQNAMAVAQEEIKEIQRQIRDHKLNILDQQRRITCLLEEVRKRLPEPVNPEQMSKIVTEQDHLLDAFYVSFEDQFRGTREDIKRRQEVYLPYIDEIAAGTDEAPVLDVGCGRGEWLELLRDTGHVAVGVDLNRVMIRQCHENNLHVIESDLIEFLRAQKAHSFGAVTGYHIIEHLPLRTFISLLDESLRVLKPGGVIIFETPNPENLIVGASTFFIDPTHKTPLFPNSVKYIAEQRGFVRTSILRLHRMREPVYTDQEFVDELIYKANLERDFSLIGYKA